MAGKYQRVLYYPIPFKNWALSKHRAQIHKLKLHKNQVQNNKEVFLFKTNVGDIVLLDTLDKLRVEIDKDTQEPSPYLKVRKNLEGLISRNVFYQLVDESYERDKELFIKSNDKEFSLGKLD